MASSNLGTSSGCSGDSEPYLLMLLVELICEGSDSLVSLSTYLTDSSPPPPQKLMSESDILIGIPDLSRLFKEKPLVDERLDSPAENK